MFRQKFSITHDKTYLALASTSETWFGVCTLDVGLGLLSKYNCDQLAVLMIQPVDETRRIEMD